MLDAHQVWDTPMLLLSEYSEADLEAECAKLWRRTQMREQFFRGELDAETYLDCLEQDGFDVPEYLNAVEENMEFVIANCIPVY